MAAPLILARTFKDAHTFAKDKLGLSFGHYRVVTSPGTIKAVRSCTLYLVPGWDKRPDRFGMKSAIRFTKNTVVDAAEMAAPEPTTIEINVVSDDTPVPQHHTDMVAKVLPGSVTLDQNVQFAEVVSDDVADFFNIPSANTPTVVPDEVKDLDEAAKATKPKAKRRSKCKDCEQMHIKGEPCIESESV